jgi:hypothetical protein
MNTGTRNTIPRMATTAIKEIMRAYALSKGQRHMCISRRVVRKIT